MGQSRYQDVAGWDTVDTLQSNPTNLQASALPSGCKTVSAGGTPSTAGVPGTVVLGSGWLLTPGTWGDGVQRAHFKDGIVREAFVHDMPSACSIPWLSCDPECSPVDGPSDG